MKISAKKTKIMCISHQGNHKVRISINGQQVEQVDQFKYLGSVISADGRCVTEIRRRIALGKQTFMNKKETVHGEFEFRVEKENSKECVVECGIVRIRNMASDSSRQKEIGSYGNVDLEKDGEN